MPINKSKHVPKIRFVGCLLLFCGQWTLDPPLQVSSSHGTLSQETLMLGESQDQTRREKLRRIGQGADRDLFMGRFAKGVEQTSSTRASVRPASFRDTEQTADGNEDVMKEFIQSELSTFFANQNDASLYVKALIADGIVAGCEC